MIKKYKPLFYLLLLASILSFFNYRGIDFSDEYNYSRNSWKLYEGTFELTPSVFNNRFGLLLPMAGFVKILGAKPFVFPIWSFIGFIILLVTNFFFTRIYDNKIALLSTLLLAINPVLLELSADISQDLVMTSFACFSIFILWRVEVLPNYFSYTYGILFSFFLFLAFATKIGVFYIGPFILFWFIHDLTKKQNYKFWIGAFSSGIVLLSAYFYWYYYLTGNPFYRINAIEGEFNVYYESYGVRSSEEFWMRMTVFPIPFLLKSYGIGVFAVLGSIWFFRFKWRRLTILPNFLFLYFLFLLVIHWFGTTSLKYYNPLIFSERMWLLLVPPLVILSAFSIDKVLPNLVGKQKKWTALYLGLISGLCALGLFLGGDRYPWFILPLFVCILLLIWMRFGNRNKSILLTIVLFPFLLVQLNNIYHYKENTPFFFQRDFLEALSTSEKHLIYTDRNLVDMYDIYYEFSPPDNIIYRKWETADSSDLADFDRFYVVYDQKKKEWLEDFLKLEVPSFVKDETVGRHILDNKYLKIKELKIEEMRKIKRFENE